MTGSEMEIIYWSLVVIAILAAFSTAELIVWTILSKTAKFSEYPTITDYAKNGSYEILEEREIVIKKKLF